MQCQTATLNSFRSILMDAQSQGLSLHPLDQQSWLGNMAICNFISMLFSFHPNISLSPSKLSSAYPFLFTFFLFVSLTPRVSWFLSPFQSLSPSIFTGALFGVFFFSLSLFDFFHARCLIKQLQKVKVWLSLSLLPFASLRLFFLLLCRFFFFSVLCLSCSPSLYVHAQQRLKRSPRTESVGVCEQE